MELMVDAGLTPMQVIQAFSKDSAEALRIDKDFGTLAKGKVADLLVLERNPLDDIRNMRTIAPCISEAGGSNETRWSVAYSCRPAELSACRSWRRPAFTIDATWPGPLPDKWITGQVGGVCVDAHDHVVIVNRRDITDEEKETGLQAPPILMFDLAGALVRSFGDPAKVPTSIHGCAFDAQNNVYVAGNNDGILQKYSHDGQLLLQIGTKGVVDTQRRHRQGNDGRVTATGGCSIPPAWRSTRPTATSTCPTAMATAAWPYSTRTARSCGSGDARPPRTRRRRASAAPSPR